MTDKMKHIPGPWEIDSANRGMVAKLIDGVYDYICDCELGGELHTHSYEQEEANAKLIAAAPDLLEACQVALECIHFLHPGCMGTYLVHFLYYHCHRDPSNAESYCHGTWPAGRNHRIQRSASGYRISLAR